MKADRITALINTHQGIFLDLACGGHKDPKAIGMDIDPWPGVDIVHNIETFPWPLPDAVCYRILASHIFEHLKPWLMYDVMAECHRIMKPKGQLIIAMPYAGSPRFQQSPSHVKAWSEVTPGYFDCATQLYGCETFKEPPCWQIELNQFHSVGDLHIILGKRDDTHGPYHRASKPLD